MIKVGQTTCPGCGGDLKYYDTVRRVSRSKHRKTSRLYIRRMRCKGCQSLHKELPDSIFPYKQYEAEMILGVLEGYITSDTLGYEIYPHEITMLRWTSQKPQLLLWR